MVPTSKQNTDPTQRGCIGCADCTGMCHALLDLAFLPETLLKRTPVAR